VVLVGQIPVRIAPVEVRVILHLEQPVHLDDPGDLGAHIGPDDGGGQLRVVLGCEFVAQVVDQRGDDGLDVCAIGLGQRGALQRVGQPADLVALDRVAQALQRQQQAVGQSADVLGLQLVQEVVFLSVPCFICTKSTVSMGLLQDGVVSGWQGGA
jgi:hypothetical protein